MLKPPSFAKPKCNSPAYSKFQQPTRVVFRCPRVYLTWLQYQHSILGRCRCLYVWTLFDKIPTQLFGVALIHFLIQGYGAADMPFGYLSFVNSLSSTVCHTRTIDIYIFPLLSLFIYLLRRNTATTIRRFFNCNSTIPTKRN
jgi:hypothetical protein